MNLLWTRLALNDRSLIFHRNDRHTAIEMDVAIEEKTDALFLDPEHGDPCLVEGTYMLDVCCGLVIVYDISGRYVRILRLLEFSAPA